MSQEQIRIPKGWKEEALEQVCEKISDRDHTTPKYTKSGIPIISPKDFTSTGVSFLNSKFISKEDHQKNSKRTDLKKGDILFSRIGTVGETRLIDFDKEFSILHSVVQIRPDPTKISQKFMYYFLQSGILQRQAKLGIRSIGTPDLGIKRIRSFRINYPSLPVQKEIVKKLDDVLIQLTEKKHECIQLVNNQDENLKILDKKITDSIFLNHISDDWNKKSFGDLILESKNGLSGTPNKDKIGVKRLGIETVTQTKDGRVDTNKCKYFDASQSDIQNYIVKKDDLFVCRQNGNKHFVGKFAVYKNEITPLIYSDSLIRFRVDTKLVLPEYIVFFMNSFSTRKQIDPFCKTQAGNYSINGTNLKKIIVDFPEPEDQTKILEQSKDIQTQSQILRQKTSEIIKLKEFILTNLNSLETSILDTAFSGKLIN